MTGKNTPTTTTATPPGTQDKKPKTFSEIISEKYEEIQTILPKHLDIKRVQRLALSVFNQNPLLQKCPQSTLAAIFGGLSLGLEPTIDGQFYVVPFYDNDKKRYIAQLIIGYKGYCTLFYNSETEGVITRGVVYEGDEFDIEYGTNQRLSHKPRFDDTKERTPKGVYVIVRLKGGVAFEYDTIKNLEDFAKAKSKSYDKKTGKFKSGSPYADKYSRLEMYAKILLRNVLKTLPKSVFLQKALHIDETGVSQIDKRNMDAPVDEIPRDIIEAESVENIGINGKPIEFGEK